MNIHANSVGMVKDIYKITNNINGKIYIGQAKNSEYRFYTHCKLSSKDCLVDFAIKKYGKENFTLEILEKQILNYNEREKYWISYFNSKVPNGYNISDGGEEPPIFYGINHPNASIKNIDILNNIIEELIDTQLSYNDIAKKYGSNKKTILGINHGTRYYNPSLNYPLRKISNINGILNEEDVDNIIEELKYSYETNTIIASHYNVSEHTIRDINAGRTHKRDNEIYPIRNINAAKSKLKYDQIIEIANKLQFSNLSMREIAVQHKIDYQLVRNINLGLGYYHRREFNYPLRLPPHQKS